VDGGEVRWDGVVGETGVVEGVAGFPWVGCEGAVWWGGGDVVEDNLVVVDLGLDLGLVFISSRHCGYEELLV
jgi:hypothetical protein